MLMTIRKKLLIVTLLLLSIFSLNMSFVDKVKASEISSEVKIKKITTKSDIDQIIKSEKINENSDLYKSLRQVQKSERIPDTSIQPYSILPNLVTTKAFKEGRNTLKIVSKHWGADSLDVLQVNVKMYNSSGLGTNKTFADYNVRPLLEMTNRISLTGWTKALVWVYTRDGSSIDTSENWVYYIDL